jgi:hypothetical protein
VEAWVVTAAIHRITAPRTAAVIQVERRFIVWINTGGKSLATEDDMQALRLDGTDINRIWGGLRQLTASFTLQANPKDRSVRYAFCQCIHCGIVKRIKVQALKRNTYGCTVCSCKICNTIHGGHLLPEYNVYNAMRNRCESPKNNSYERYGGRGIKVCERWKESFLNFYEDMGQRPSPSHSIERNDNDGDYEPGNCRWATDKEQCRNRRSTVMLTHNGRTQSMLDWADELGINRYTIMRRWQRGFTVEQILHQGKHKPGKSYANQVPCN